MGFSDKEKAAALKPFQKGRLLNGNMKTRAGCRGTGRISRRRELPTFLIVKKYHCKTKANFVLKIKYLFSVALKYVNSQKNIPFFFKIRFVIHFYFFIIKNVGNSRPLIFSRLLDTRLLFSYILPNN